MRYHLHTPTIAVLVVIACANVALYCAIPYAKPIAEAVADYVIQRVARAVYRDTGCGLMLD